VLVIVGTQSTLREAKHLNSTITQGSGIKPFVFQCMIKYSQSRLCSVANTRYR